MEEKGKIKTYSAQDIEKYHKGELSPDEMNAIEKAALDDPFLADAIEGYNKSGIDPAKDIAELRARIAERVSKEKVVPIGSSKSFATLWKAAAMIILVGGAGFFIYKLVGNNSETTVALEKTKSQEISSPSSQADSSRAGFIDDVAKNENTTVKQKTGAGEKPVNKLSQSLDSSLKLEQETLAADGKSNESGVSSTQPVTVENKKEDLASIKARRNADETGVKNNSVPQDDKKQAISIYGEANLDPKQFNKFRGQVVDPNKNALPFANVTNVRDSVGTYADASGYFTLVSPDSVLNVQVKALGFENTNVVLRNDLPKNQVVLQESNNLNEVVLRRAKVNANRAWKNNQVVEEPEPVDGWAKYDSYLANNLNPPDNFKAKALPGKVEVSFEINNTGHPVNIKVETPLCDECDQEAIRLIKEGPKWKKKGKKSRANVTVSFND